MKQLMTALSRAGKELDDVMLHKNLKTFTKEEYAILYLETEQLINKINKIRNVENIVE